MLVKLCSHQRHGIVSGRLSELIKLVDGLKGGRCAEAHLKSGCPNCRPTPRWSRQPASVAGGYPSRCALRLPLNSAVGRRRTS